MPANVGAKRDELAAAAASTRQQRHRGEKWDRLHEMFEPAWSTRTEDAAPLKLSLAAGESYENEVVYLNYRPQA